MDTSRDAPFSSDISRKEDHLMHKATSFLHITAERRILFQALTRQQSLVERRTSLPILSHILLEAKDGVLLMKGTDMEMSLLETLPACVHQEGSVVVPAHKMHDIIKAFPENHDIHCQSSRDRLLVSCASIKFDIPTMDAQDFPHVAPAQDFPFQIKIKPDVLKGMLDDTRFSMSSEEARHFLNGIYFHPKGHQWCAVATDAQRLALSIVEMDPVQISHAPGVIIGRKTVQEMVKILADTKEEVSLSLSDSSMLMSFESGVFISRLLEGQFPDYWRAIPKDHPRHVCLDLKSFQEAVRRVGMVSADKDGNIKMMFEKGTLTLSTQSQKGSAEEVLEIEYSGDPVLIALNPKYVQDVCQHIKGGQIKIVFKDTQLPVLFYDADCPHVTFVIMPMNVVA